MEDSIRNNYLVCEVDGQRYAITVADLKEIANIGEAAPAAELPYYCKGIITLRGESVPIVDLRMRMHLSDAEKTRYTKYIITMTNGKMIFENVGYIVDNVFEVREFSEDDIFQSPAITSGNWQGFVTGAVKTDSGIVMILDTNKLLTDDFTSAADALAARLAAESKESS